MVPAEVEVVASPAEALGASKSTLRLPWPPSLQTQPLGSHPLDPAPVEARGAYLREEGAPVHRPSVVVEAVPFRPVEPAGEVHRAMAVAYPQVPRKCRRLVTEEAVAAFPTATVVVVVADPTRHFLAGTLPVSMRKLWMPLLVNG